MLKKLLAIIISMTIFLGVPTISFAADTVVARKGVSETITVDELIEHLNAIDFGREITFTALPQSQLDGQELLNFESVEAAEKYLKQFIAEPKELTIPAEIFEQNQLRPESLARANSGWYTTTVWWWGNGSNSILAVTNAEIRFYYNSSGGGTVSNITVNNSYMTGIVAASWTHRSGTGTALGGMDTKYSVTGTWLIGLDIYGLPVGASFNDTLESPKITIDMDNDF